jgi:hypothetical protein
VLYIISYITDDELDDICVVEKFPAEILPSLSEENRENNTVVSEPNREVDNKSMSEYVRCKLEGFIGFFRKDQNIKTLNVKYENNINQGFDKESNNKSIIVETEYKNKPIIPEIEKLYHEKSSKELEELKEKVSILEMENLKLRIDKLDLIHDIESSIKNIQNDSLGKPKKRVDSIHN